MNKKFQQFEKGFSVIELVVVVIGLMILSTIAVMSFNSLEMTKADRQASELVDILQEARQRAITQRRTMRVEINETDKVIRLINERDAGNATDDVAIREVSYVGGVVSIGSDKPLNTTSDPSESTPVSIISFNSNSPHPLSSGDNVATLRFFSNGRVRDAGDDAIGTNSIVKGATILVWSKRPNDTSASSTVANILRAVTVTNSGVIRIRKCSKNASGEWATWK